MTSKLHFALLLLLSNYKKHRAVFGMSTLLIALVASVMFMTTSLKHQALEILKEQADITLQRFEAGRVLPTPKEWLDTVWEIDGVSHAEGRIYGEHFYEPKENYFMIIGVDPYAPQVAKNLHNLIEDLNISEFLEGQKMIIGSGVKEFFDEYAYKRYYTFRPPDRSKERVYIYKVLPKESALVSADAIVMKKSLARKILGIEEGYYSDIVLNIANKDERETVYEKLVLEHFNSRIITKEDIAKHFEHLFNYKGGFFLVLYLVTLTTFFLILYQRYSMIRSEDVKEIAILRLVGWRISHLVWLKLFENFVIALFAYVWGVILALVFVYILGAPLLRAIFFGYANLSNNAPFYLTLKSGDLVLLFFIFVVPFLLAILFPLWRVATQEASEVLR